MRKDVIIELDSLHTLVGYYGFQLNGMQKWTNKMVGLAVKLLREYAVRKARLPAF